jgi:hypothetical protein
MLQEVYMMKAFNKMREHPIFFLAFVCFYLESNKEHPIILVHCNDDKGR